MLKRTLFFSNPAHLSTKYNQLIITDKSNGEIKQAPIEDLGFVVLDNQQITFTQSVMQELAANNTAVVICDKKHMPATMMFHLDTSQVQSQRFRYQVSASEPLKKQLWQQTVKVKIKNQAALLKHIGKSDDALNYIAAQVKSGDSTNEEAKASRHYWKYLFGEGFRRDRFGAPPNPSLNYGYAILRAAVARALAGSGLLPTLGINHHNKYNAFCLADDIMEPYRPFVDKAVLEIRETIPAWHSMSKEVKAKLLEVLTCDIVIGGNKSPLMVGLSETTASLVKCFEGTEKRVKYPAFK